MERIEDRYVSLMEKPLYRKYAKKFLYIEALHVKLAVHFNYDFDAAKDFVLKSEKLNVAQKNYVLKMLEKRRKLLEFVRDLEEVRNKIFSRGKNL